MGWHKYILLLLSAALLFSLASWGQQVDIAGPDALSWCEQATYMITFTNGSVQTASSIVITNTLPNEDFAYVLGSSQLTLHDGTVLTDHPQEVGLELQWDLDQLLPEAYELPPDEGITLLFDLRTNCDTLSGTNLVRVEFERDEVAQDVTDSLSIEILPGAIGISKDPSEIPASVGDEVTWTVTVESTGLGAIRNVVVTDVLGPGMEYVSSSPAGDNVGQTTLWDASNVPALEEIAAGDAVQLQITARLVACEGLFNDAQAQFGCDETETVTASIRLIVKNPLLDWSPPDIEMPYCSLEGVEGAIPITNIGEGPATNVRLCVDCSPLVIDDVVEGASYVDGCFHLDDPIPAGETFDLTFTVIYPGDWCEGVPSGTILCEPIYENVCGEEFRPPVQFGSFSTTYGPEGPPSLSVSLQGPSQVYICTTDDNDYLLDVEFSGLDECGNGATSDIAVQVAVPDGFAVHDDGGGTWEPGGDGTTGGTINWTVPPTDPLSTMLTLTAPGTDQCGQVATLTATATAYDCCGCEISSTSSVPIAIECFQLVTVVREATPSTQEKCGAITYTNTYTFEHEDVNLPEITFTDLTFIAYAENAQEFDDGSLEITIDGSPVDPLGVVDSTPGCCLTIEGIDDSSLVWDSTLVISYTLELTPDSLPDSCPSSHTFFTWTTLDLGEACTTGDACTEPCQVTETLVVTSTTPSMSVSVSGLPDDFVDPCGTYDVTVTLTKTSTYDPHEVYLTLGNLNYYIVDLSAIIGVQPEHVTPVDHGTYYEWTYGDAFEGVPEGAESRLELQVQKRCGPGLELRADAYFKDACGGECSRTATDSPAFLRTPFLLIRKTPEVILARENQVTWDIYVTNSGSGYAYGVWVDDVMGSGLSYYSSSVTPQATINGVSWLIEEIPPGDTVKIEVTADLEACAGLVNAVSTNAGCGGEDCLVTVMDDSEVRIHASSVVATSVTKSPIDTCEGQQATITIRNAGFPAVYDLVVSESLPEGIAYMPNTTEWRVDDESWTSGFDPDIVGDTLTWTAYEITGLAELLSGETLEIRFDIKAFCDFDGGNLVVNVDYNNVCGDPRSAPVGSFFLDVRKPSLTVTKTQIPSGAIDCGAEVTWRIDVRNTGNATAEYIWVEDTLGSGFVYVGSEGDGVYSVDDGCPTGTGVTWALVGLPVNATASVYLTAEEFDCGELTNKVEAWWGCISTADNSCVDLSDCLTTVPATRTITGTRTPTVRLSSALDPGQIGACGEATFTLSIENTSTATASAIDARINLPDGLSYVDGSTEIDCGTGFEPAPDPDELGGYLYWYDAGSTADNMCDAIAPEGIIQLRFGIQAACYTSAGSVGVRVYYRDCCLHDRYSRTTSRTLSPAVPELTVSKTPDTVALDCHDPEDTVTWTITVTNTGDAPADWVRIEDELGAHLIYEGSSPEATDDGTGTRIWELGSLAPDESHTVELTARLDPPPDDCSPAPRTNTARAAWGCGEPDTGDTCNSGVWVEDTAIVTVPDLSASTAELTASCNVDGSFTVEATVRNLGDGDATGVSIRVYLGEDDRVYATTQDIPAGGSHNLVFTSEPLGCYDPHRFRVVVDEENEICECDTTNNEATVTASCPCPALVTDKRVDRILRGTEEISVDGPIEPGDVVTYLLEVTNVGDGWAYNVNLQDELPEEFQYVGGSTEATWPLGSSNTDPAGVPGPNLAWTLDATLRGGETLTLTFDATVTSAIRQGFSYTNTMWATGEEGDGTPIPPDSSDRVPEDDDPDDSSSVTLPTVVPALRVEKEITDVLRGGESIWPVSAVEPGDVIVFEFLIENIEMGTAYNVDFTDELPFGVEYDTTYGDGIFTVDNPAAGPTSLGIADGAAGLITADISATIAGGGTLTAVYRVRVTSEVSQGVDLVNTAEAAGEDGAANPIPEFNEDVGDGFPDSDDTRIGVHEPGLALTKAIVDVLRDGQSIWPTPIVLWGDVIVYEVTVKNVGLGTAYNVDFTDQLPFGVAYDTTHGAGTYEVDDPAEAGDLGIPDGTEGSIAAGLSLQINGEGALVAVYRVRVTPEAIPGSYLTNLAEVTGEDGAGTPIPEFNPDVNDTFPDEDSTTIRLGAPALVTDKDIFCDLCDPDVPCYRCQPEPLPVYRGMVIPFELTVRNVGYSTAYEINVEDVLPPGFAYLEGSTTLRWPGGQLEGEEADPLGAEGSELWWATSVELHAGETLTVLFDALVTDDAPLGEKLTNTMWASGVDDFGEPIPPDSSEFVPEDDDPMDSSELVLLVHPPPGADEGEGSPDADSSHDSARAENTVTLSCPKEA